MAKRQSRVIQAGTSAPGTPVPFHFDDIQALAKQMLARANQQAQRILENARQEAEKIEQDAQQQGQAKGHEEGLAKGAEEGRERGHQEGRQAIEEATRTLSETLQGLLEELSAERLALRNSAEVDLVNLALAVAARVVKREVRLDHDVALANVRAAVELTVKRRDLVVLVHPEDLEAVKGYLPELERAFQDLDRVDVQPDVSVDRGGVRVRNREGEVDLRIAEQLRALERSLTGATHELDRTEPEADEAE